MTAHCDAEKRQGPGTCKQAAGWGTDHPGIGRCKLHGGKTESHNAAARREQAQAAAGEFGLSREIDAPTALVEELHRTAGLVSFYGFQAASLDNENLHGPVGGGQFSIPKEEAHVWIRLHQEEREHFTRVAKACIECGIAERQIKLAEEQGELIARVLQGVLSDLGVDDKPEVREVVRRHLTLVAAAA
jgi:hypothetical protein